MKKLYDRFGFSICFDYTYNIFSEDFIKDGGERRGYLLALICGYSSCQKIAVYGFGVTPGENREYTEWILKEFFTYMGSDCESILTDKGLGIIAGVKQLQRDRVFSGEHLYDYYHLAKNLKFDGS